jgi:hypothetical protein
MMTLQLEPDAVASEEGLRCLIDAFPDEDESFDLCGYSAGKVCTFLSLSWPATTLPSRGQVTAILCQLADHVLAGRTVFTMKLPAAEQAVLRRLADVVAEVVVDGASRRFALLEGYHEQDGAVGICVSQGFCDLVLGRWEAWSGTRDGTGSVGASPTDWVGIPA